MYRCRCEAQGREPLIAIVWLGAKKVTKRRERFSWTSPDNLTPRQPMLLTTGVHDERPEPLSFTPTLQVPANTWLPATRASPLSSDTRGRLVTLRLTDSHSYRVGNCPNRIEPRAIKRRPTKQDLLTRPRAQACARCIAQRAS